MAEAPEDRNEVWLWAKNNPRAKQRRAALIASLLASPPGKTVVVCRTEEEAKEFSAEMLAEAKRRWGG